MRIPGRTSMMEHALAEDMRYRGFQVERRDGQWWAYATPREVDAVVTQRRRRSTASRERKTTERAKTMVKR